MTAWSRFRSWAAAAFGRSRLEREMDAELRFHIEACATDLERRGMAPDEALREARRRFGAMALAKDECRDARGLGGTDALLQDLRYGARVLRRSPAFTATAVLALALGIGATTAIFSVVDAVLLRPLPYPNADELVTILHGGNDPVSVANYADWREGSRAFTDMGAAEYWSPDLTGVHPPERVFGLRVSSNLLPLVGVQPLLGRMFSDGADETGAPDVILGYGLWQRRFGGSPDVLGRTITLNRRPYTIVGVMPAGFQFAPFWATRSEMWVPAAFGARRGDREGNSLRLFARLKPGTTLAQARADLAVITTRLERQYPGTNRDVQILPLKEKVTGRIALPLLVLLGGVGFVLLIACANVAHMLLARAAVREREIALRTALGAGRLRIVRQLFVESLLLAMLGAAAGLLLAYWGTQALVALSPAQLPRVETIAIDARVLLFVIAITVLTSVACGLVPALRGSDVRLTGTLREGGRGGSESLRRNRLRSVLVASEFALALVLLTGAGLMIRSFAALRSLDPGFDPRHVLTMTVSVVGSDEAAPGRRAGFYQQLLERVRALPGVASAGGINHLPLAGDLWGLAFAIEGRPTPRPGESPRAVYRIITPGYLETMRQPVLRGRDVTAADDLRAPGVVLINERAAAHYWPGEDPLGRRVTFFEDDQGKPVWLTVVGVVKDARQGDWAAEAEPELYQPAWQNRSFLESPAAHHAYLTLVIRATGDPAALVPSVKDAIWSLDRNLPIADVQTMEAVVREANAQPRFEMLLLGIFALVALVLAAVGIYGVMSYSVSRRTQEIGIRLSLGAGRGAVMRLVLAQGLALAIAGSVAGIAGALVATRLMAKMLYGVPPADPATFLTVPALLLLVALAACAIPAGRAMRVDPMVALRHE